MSIKKTVVITFRTDEQVKDMLEKIAEEKEWSVSQVVDKLCRNYLNDQLQKEEKY